MKISILFCNFHFSGIPAVFLGYHGLDCNHRTKLDLSIFVCFQDVGGCNTSPVEGADSGDSSLVYLCSAQSREDGTFIFPSLASGEYTVVRFLLNPKNAVFISYFCSHVEL